MRAEPGRAVVLTRALVLAATSTAVSALAHVVGGGRAPLGPLLGLAALQLALATRVGRRPLTAGRVVAWAAAAQAATHLTLAWLHPATGTDVVVLGHHGLEHAHAAAAAGHATTGSAGLAMLAAHVLGTLVVALLAPGADRAAAAVVARWSVVLAALEAPSPLVAPRPHAAPTPAPARSTSPLRHALVRRGPPVPATV